MFKCKICDKDFNAISGLKNHHWRTHGNGISHSKAIIGLKYEKIKCETCLKYISKTKFNQHINGGKCFPIKKCQGCNILINKSGKYCSHECYSNTLIGKKHGPLSNEQKTKISKTKISKSKITEDKKVSFRRYRERCSFRFDVTKYPQYFDIELLNLLGWYNSGPNKKNPNRVKNTKGISRDHRFSILDGFNLGVDCEIIKHPANCQLVTQSTNSKKNSKSSITLEMLLEDIKKFDEQWRV